MERTEFLKHLAILGIGSQLSLIYSCSDEKTVVIPENHLPLSKNKVTILAFILEILFPNDGNGPSVQQLNSLEYILWNLRDKNRDKDSNAYVTNGIDWIEETSIEEMGKSFLGLKYKEKEELINLVSNKKWGEDWLSTILTLIFESLLYDPIYNINKNEIGWNWLNHKTGLPRPV